MRLNNIPFLIVFIVMHGCFGDIELSCNTVDQMLPSTISCTCRYENGKGILWYKNNKYIADCYLRTEVCLLYNGHSISVNRSEKTYTISKTSYYYSSCDVYTCLDFNQPKINASQRITVHDSTSISALKVSEPTSNHTSGFIGVITECIYGASSEVTYLDIQWLVVTGGVEKPFHPMNTTIKPHNGSCQLCDGDKAMQFRIGFYHKQEMECQAKEAKFRIILRHKGISSEPLNITTRNFYCVSDQTSDGSTSTWSTINYILILFIIFVLTQYSVLAYICIDRKRNTNCPGKMKSCSTTLKRSQDKLLVLAYVPACGIIGIIAYIYTCCSGTDTEGKSAKEVNLNQKAFGRTRDSFTYRTSTFVRGRKTNPTGDREEDVENTRSERKPDNLNNGSNSDGSLPPEGDCTKHNDSDDGYISNCTSTHSSLSNLKKM